MKTPWGWWPRQSLQMTNALPRPSIPERIVCAATLVGAIVCGRLRLWPLPVAATTLDSAALAFVPRWSFQAITNAPARLAATAGE